MNVPIETRTGHLKLSQASAIAEKLQDEGYITKIVSGRSDIKPGEDRHRVIARKIIQIEEKQ